MADSQFTSTALGAIRLAQQNAARLGHSYVGSEHLLLGLAGALGNLAWAALTATVAAGLVITLEGKWNRRLWKGLATYWLFLLTWLPITACSFWKKTTVWEEIRHTRTVAPPLPGR